MEFVMGAAIGAAIALAAAHWPVRREEKQVLPPVRDDDEQRLARQWENLLNYNGGKQHED